MTATNHVLTGALIAASVHSPWVALPAAFASHFVLDIMPHFGRAGINLSSSFFKRLLYTDMVIAAVCLIGLFMLRPENGWILVTGGVLGASPDLMWYAKFVAANNNQQPPTPGFIRRFHSRIQWYEKPPGIIIEAIWCLAMLALLGQTLID